MSDDTNALDSHLSEIGQFVRQGQAVLFLGAGASVAAGGPTASQLVSDLKCRFPKADQQISDFNDLCGDIVDTPPYSRYDLDEFIRSKLEVLLPSSAHRLMANYAWPALFTTNYDDLVELSFKEAGRLCRPITADRFSVVPSDPTRTFLFKIMGCIRSAEGQSGQMVLTRSEYNNALLRRRRYLEQLSDFLKSGRMVFIGYSFRDLLVIDIIDSLKDIYGEDRIPWSYALFPDYDPADEKTSTRLLKRRVIPVHSDFQTFFEYLKKNATTPPVVVARDSIHITIRGQTFEVDHSQATHLTHNMEVLCDEKMNETAGNRDEFFTGKNGSWGAFHEGWDFLRHIYSRKGYIRTVGNKPVAGCLRDRLTRELDRVNVADNKLLLVLGMPGAGKSTLLRRAAYDVFRSGRSPVFILRSDRVTYDFKLIASFIEDLNARHAASHDQSEGEFRSIKALIVIDDVGARIQQIYRLLNYLTSRGRPVLILAAERTAEWEMWGKPSPLKADSSDVYRVDERLLEDERPEVVEHLTRLGYVGATAGFQWNRIIEEQFADSFFALMYTLVHPSRRPFDEIIRDQYTRLGEVPQRAFRYLCSFQKFGLPMNVELLVRALMCDYTTFYKDIFAREAADLIFDKPGESGLLVLHHRIIAEKTASLFFPDPEMQKEIYVQILSQANLSNSVERQLCERLIIHYIGPNAKATPFSYDQQKAIFEAVCEKNPVRSLVHHWGVLETDNLRFPEAEKLLKRALELPRDDIEAYRGESDQNILTSLGVLYSKWGLAAQKRNDQPEAEAFFERAEECFQQAKHGESANVHAYHSHGFMWYQKALHSEDTARTLCLASALEITSLAKDNLNTDELQIILELETQCWAELEAQNNLDACIASLQKEYNSGKGYYLVALRLYNRLKAGDKDDATHRKEIQRKCFSKIEGGLAQFPADEPLLGLKCRLLILLTPHDYDTLYESLVRWHQGHTTPNARLLYQLGICAFTLTYYEDSERYFTELERGVGAGHRHRSLPKHPIVDDESGEIEQFTGTIVDLPARNEGFLKCDELRTYRRYLPFRPLSCKFTPAKEDRVSFQISFNYRGPLADEVQKL